MKLYTEEQVKSAFRIGLRENYIDEQDAENFANKGIKYLTPIELPSNEEIIEGANGWVFETPENRWSNNNDEAGDNFGSFIRGAKWMKEQILNQNK